MTSSADLVTNLYAAILDRAPEPTGFVFWVQALDAGTPLQQVRNGFAYSPESTDRIEALSAAANAKLTDGQVVIYEDELASGSSFAQVRANFGTDRITSLYNDVLGRSPEAAGLAFWQGQLASGASFQDMQNGIAYSQEATNRVQALAGSQAIPLSGAEIVSYETQLAGGRSFSQMTADLDANNIVAPQPFPDRELPEAFVAPPLEAQAAPVGGSVQPFAALHLYESGVAATFSATVSPSQFGTSGGLSPVGTILSNPTTGTVNPYGDYSVSGTRTQVEDALRNLTLSLNPNGDGVSLSAQIYGGNIFPGDVYENVSAATSSPAGGLNFIYGTSGNDLLSGSAGSDLFILGAGQSGYDTIANFDPAHDILQLNASAASSFADVQANVSAVGPGAYIRLGSGGAVELLGVAPSSLHAQNFSFV